MSLGRRKQHLSQHQLAEAEQEAAQRIRDIVENIEDSQRNVRIFKQRQQLKRESLDSSGL